MTSYGYAQEAVMSPAKPHWWQHRRNGAVIILVVLLAASLWLVGTPDETLLLALDGNSGRTQWSMPAPVGADEEGIGIPIAADGRLYVSVVTPPAANMLLPLYHYELRALDAANGTLLWTFTPDPSQFRGQLAAEITSMFAPIVTSDTLYISLINLDYQAWIVALDARTGQVKWQQPNLYFSDASFRGLSGLILNTVQQPKFTVAGGKLFALLRSKLTASTDKQLSLTLMALDAQTGASLWDSAVIVDPNSVDTATNVAADDRHVYVTTNKTTVFDAQTGATQTTEAATLIVITDDAIYRRGEQTLTVTDRATEQQRWQYTMPVDFGCSRFAIGAHSVFIFCTHIDQDKADDADDDKDKLPENWENFLVALDVTTGTERWRKPIAENLFTVLSQTPATFGDRVAVVGGALGELRVMTFTDSGDAAWSYHLRFSYDQAITDGSRVYVIDTRPRWRGWLSLLNPAWR